MTDAKHPAEVQADWLARFAGESDMAAAAASQLRRIPALEAERDEAIQQQAAALGLVSRIRFALGDNGTRMQDELIEWCKELADDAHDRNALMQRHNALAKNAAECRQERDALRAEVEQWQRSFLDQSEVTEQFRAEVERLTAGDVRYMDEVEALRRDAERYRWLRRDITSLADINRMIDIVERLCEGDMDAAIDAARSKA